MRISTLRCALRRCKVTRLRYTIRQIDMQPYIHMERTYKWSRNTIGLIIFELIVLCVLFQLLAQFSLRLTPKEAIEPMILCVLLIVLAQLLCGAYEWSCFRSLPTMYIRGFQGFFLGAVLCALLINWMLPSVNELRFEFAFIFASIIVLTTLRSLICGAMTGKNERNRRQSQPLN